MSRLTYEEVALISDIRKFPRPDSLFQIAQSVLIMERDIQLEAIQGRLENAAKNGRTSIRVASKDMSESTRSFLQDYGYSVVAVENMLLASDEYYDVSFCPDKVVLEDR